MSARIQQVKDKNLDYLYQRRDFLDQIRIKLSDSFDKYLLGFATGALGLSITFTKTIVTNIKSIELLACGWGCLILAIITSLISIFLSIAAHEKQMLITDDVIEDISANQVPRQNNNPYNPFVYSCQCISIIAFVLGISILAFFYFYNLK